MQIGISTASLFPGVATEDALKKIAGTGADCAEAAFATFYEYRPEFSSAPAMQAGKVAVHSVSADAFNFESNLFSPSRRVRGDGMYWLDQLCRSAQKLGCKNYAFRGCVRNPSERADIGFLGSCLAEAVGFVSGYGVSLCLRNAAGFLYDRPGIFGALKERIPALSGVFSMEGARRSHYPYQAYIKDMSRSISFVYLSDVDGEGRVCLPGEGVCDFGDIFRMLRDEGFGGCLMIRVCGRPADEVSLARSVGYIGELSSKIF